jgi:hypothetical protein
VSENDEKKPRSDLDELVSLALDAGQLSFRGDSAYVLTEDGVVQLGTADGDTFLNGLFIDDFGRAPTERTRKEATNQLKAFALHQGTDLDAAAPPEEWRGDPNVLAEKLVAYFDRYLSIGRAELAMLVMWVFHTHLFVAFQTTPYLHVHSPTKRCGKSRLLSLLSWLSANAYSMAVASDASLYRMLKNGTVTMIMDEIDNIQWRDRDVLLGILNLGFEDGNTVPRVDKDSGEVEHLPTFCPKVLAGIGLLPADTLADRAIRIEMVRRAEQKTRMRRRVARMEGVALREQLRAFAASVDLDEFAALEPQMPRNLDDRAIDIGEPLVMVADLIGGPWPRRVREALVELLAGRDEDDGSLEVDLLKRIRDAFTGEIQSIASIDLITAICSEDDSPWRAWWWDSKESTPNTKAARQLALRLKAFGVVSVKERGADGRHKRYRRGDLDPIWRRYFGDAGDVCQERDHRDHRDQNANRDQKNGLVEPNGQGGQGGHGSRGYRQKQQTVPAPLAVGDPGYEGMLRLARFGRHLTEAEYRTRLRLHDALTRTLR